MHRKRVSHRTSHASRARSLAGLVRSALERQQTRLQEAMTAMSWADAAGIATTGPSCKAARTLAR